MAETPVLSSLLMDRGDPLGNSLGPDARRRLHVKVSNDVTEPVPVSIVAGSTYIPVNTYAEISAAPAASEIPIASYTVPAGKVLYLSLVEFDGTNIAEYRVKLNGTTIAKRRTWYGGDIAGQFVFATSLETAFKLSAADIVTITVLHLQLSPGDFAARIQGALQ